MGAGKTAKLGDCRSMAHKMSAIIVNSAIIEQVKSAASSKKSRKRAGGLGKITPVYEISLLNK